MRAVKNAHAPEDDSVVVFSIDRLARDLRDLQGIIQTVNDKGATIKFLSEGLTFSADNNDELDGAQVDPGKLMARGNAVKKAANVGRNRIGQ